MSAAETKFVEKIRGRSTRSRSNAEREEIAGHTQDDFGVDSTFVRTTEAGRNVTADAPPATRRWYANTAAAIAPANRMDKMMIWRRTRTTLTNWAE